MTHATRTMRFWRRALGWVLLAMVVLPIGWAVVDVWVPYQRTQTAIRYVESAGGNVRTEVEAPEWLVAVHARLNFLPAQCQSWLANAEGELFRTPTGVHLNDTATDDDLEHLGRLTTLKWLNLSSKQVSDVGLVHLQGLTNLEILRLRGTQVSDGGLVHLTGLTSLRWLDLQNAQVSDAGLAHLRRLTSLEKLILKRTLVSDAGLAHLTGLTNLRFLFLRNTQVTTAGVKDLQQALPNTEIVWYPPAVPRE